MIYDLLLDVETRCCVVFLRIIVISIIHVTTNQRLCRRSEGEMIKGIRLVLDFFRFFWSAARSTAGTRDVTFFACSLSQDAAAGQNSARSKNGVLKTDRWHYGLQGSFR